MYMYDGNGVASGRYCMARRLDKVRRCIAFLLVFVMFFCATGFSTGNSVENTASRSNQNGDGDFIDIMPLVFGPLLHERCELDVNFEELIAFSSLAVTHGEMADLHVYARPGRSVYRWAFSAPHSNSAIGQVPGALLANTETSLGGVQNTYGFAVFAPGPPTIYASGPTVTVFTVPLRIDITDVDSYDYFGYNWNDHVKTITVENLMSNFNITFEPVILDISANFGFVVETATPGVFEFLGNTLRIDQIVEDRIYITINGVQATSGEILIAPRGDHDIGTHTAIIEAHTERLAERWPLDPDDNDCDIYVYGHLYSGGYQVPLGIFDVYEFVVNPRLITEVVISDPNSLPSDILNITNLNPRADGEDEANYDITSTSNSYGDVTITIDAPRGSLFDTENGVVLNPYPDMPGFSIPPPGWMILYEGPSDDGNTWTVTLAEARHVIFDFNGGICSTITDFLIGSVQIIGPRHRIFGTPSFHIAGEPTTHVRLQHTFRGWQPVLPSSSTTLLLPGTITGPVSEDREYLAIWEMRIIDVDLSNIGDDSSPGNTDLITVPGLNPGDEDFAGSTVTSVSPPGPNGEKTITIPAPPYTYFDGNNMPNVGNPPYGYVVVGPPSVDNNGNLVVVIRPVVDVEHPVTFNFNGGSYNNSSANYVRNVQDGDEVGDNTPYPTRPSHTFGGWQINGTGQIFTCEDVAKMQVFEELTFVAVWTPTNNNQPTPTIPPTTTTPDPDPQQTPTPSPTTPPTNPTEVPGINIVPNPDNSTQGPDGDSTIVVIPPPEGNYYFGENTIITPPPGYEVIHVYIDADGYLHVTIRQSTPDYYATRSVHYAFIIGFDDGYVRPHAPLTRAHIATIIFRLMPHTERAHYWMQTNPFPDVSLNQWFNNGISTVTNAGIFTGMPDGTFQPQRHITRAELAVAVVRFNGASPSTGAPMYADIAGH